MAITVCQCVQEGVTGPVLGPAATFRTERKKTVKRRIFTMLLVLVMVFSLTTAALAAETGTETAGLSLELAKAEGETVVTVYLTGCDGVTNGRFCVSYDAEVLTLVGVEASDAYAMSSVNDQTAGTVSLAWVGSQLTAEKTLMLTLRFTKAEDSTADVTYTAEGDGIYAGTGEVEVAPGSVTDPYAPDVDKSALEEAIAEAESKSQDDYTEESWADLEEALADAEAVLADENATQDEVDAAAEALKEAIAALEEKPDVDKSELEKAIKKAKSLKKKDYTKKSWDAMEAALAIAEKVMADEDATQDEVDAAADALNKAIKALVPTTGKNPGTGDETMLILPMVLAAAALMGIAAMVCVNKRRNRA